MIDRNDTYHIGRITRIRGLKGEVELRFTDDAFDRGDSPYLFMDMDGLLVPFFWEEYGFKNKETAIFSFPKRFDTSSINSTPVDLERFKIAFFAPA